MSEQNKKNEIAREAAVKYYQRQGLSVSDAKIRASLDDIGDRLLPMLEHYGVGESAGKTADQRYGEQTDNITRQLDSARTHIDSQGSFGSGSEEDYRGLDSLQRLYMNRDPNRGRTGTRR